MILPVYVYGHPVLRKVSVDIDKDYEGFDKLLKDMWQTMYETDGVGLAAPQIGKNIRLFVIDADPFKELDPKAEGFKKVFINAEILERDGEKWPMTEGCLSVPNIHEDVYREDKVRIRYLDENWEEHEEEYDGYRARVIQHEYDHIEGKLFIDHVSPLKKRLLKGKLAAISKGKAKCHYRVVTP
jgi:peptide deformylase